MEELTRADIESIFTHHTPSPSQIEMYIRIRCEAREVGYLLLDCFTTSPAVQVAISRLQVALRECCPPSFELDAARHQLRSIGDTVRGRDALLHLQIAVMLANAAIAIHTDSRAAIGAT